MSYVLIPRLSTAQRLFIKSRRNTNNNKNINFTGRTHFYPARRVYAPQRVIYSPAYIAAVHVICNAALSMRRDVVLDRMTVINPIRACGTARPNSVRL